MRPVTVVVLDVPMDDGFEVSATEDEHPVKTFTPDSPDESLGECVGTGCLESAFGRFGFTLCPKDLVEVWR